MRTMDSNRCVVSVAEVVAVDEVVAASLEDVAVVEGVKATVVVDLAEETVMDKEAKVVAVVVDLEARGRTRARFRRHPGLSDEDLSDCHRLRCMGKDHPWHSCIAWVSVLEHGVSVQNYCLSSDVQRHIDFSIAPNGSKHMEKKLTFNITQQRERVCD